MTSKRVLVFVALPLASAQQYLAVDWSSKTYGPDGPWNAITVNVGGSQGTNDISSQQTSVDLLVGTYDTSFIPSSTQCEPYSSSPQCGAGGEWIPKDTDSLQSTAKIWDAPSKINTSATIYSQAVTIGTSGNQTTVYGVNVASMDYGSVTYGNGATTGMELGFFALNSGMSKNQFFTPTGSNGTTDPWNVAGYLYNQSIIPSYSYGLHIGSASLDYPGSLYLGGYDKGRAIGPYASFTGYINSLLDITIGVETGESPFSFPNKSGLLISDGSVAAPVTVKIDPMPPGLHLPPQTCAALAAALPVYLDQTTNYYLWNTSDPLYEKVVSSPAYLGFKFKPAPGATANVTIKVPFKLLNLTLTSPVVSSPLQYFPCQPFVLPSSADQFRLGRAFLQAAFFGYNSNTGITWLAQAPGPGASNQGLGLEPKQISDDAADIDVYSDSTLFNSSWADHWTPISDATSTSNSSSVTPSQSVSSTASATSSSASKKEHTSISSGAIAGATIGSIAGVSLIAAILFFFLRRKTKSTDSGLLNESGTNHGTPQHHSYSEDPNTRYEGQNQPFLPAELSSKNEIKELGSGMETKELPLESGFKELPGDYHVHELSTQR